MSRSRIGATDRQPAQGLVEAALALMLLLPLAIGLVGLARLQQAQAGVDAVAYEAARAAVLANNAREAQDLGSGRGQALAPAYGLSNGTLDLVIQAEPFGRGQPMQAAASYTVHFDDLPLLGWASRPVRARHVEFVETYRSLAAGRR
jgi:Flp pilus assembly protein TadG